MAKTKCNEVPGMLPGCAREFGELKVSQKALIAEVRKNHRETRRVLSKIFERLDGNGKPGVITRLYLNERRLNAHLKGHGRRIVSRRWFIAGIVLPSIAIIVSTVGIVIACIN